jgi:hypothetical protein
MIFVQVDSKTIDNCVRCASDMWQSAHDCRPSLPIGMRFKQIMVEDWHECVLELNRLAMEFNKRSKQ